MTREYVSWLQGASSAKILGIVGYQAISNADRPGRGSDRLTRVLQRRISRLYAKRPRFGGPKRALSPVLFITGHCRDCPCDAPLQRAALVVWMYEWIGRNPVCSQNTHHGWHYRYTFSRHEVRAAKLLILKEWRRVGDSNPR